MLAYSILRCRIFYPVIREYSLLKSCHLLLSQDTFYIAQTLIGDFFVYFFAIFRNNKTTNRIGLKISIVHLYHPNSQLDTLLKMETAPALIFCHPVFAISLTFSIPLETISCTGLFRSFPTFAPIAAPNTG